MNKIRYGVIGIGNMGSAHAKALYDGNVAGAVLSAVSDIDEARLSWAREHFTKGVEVCADYHALLTTDKVDAVLIATPHYTHPIIAKEAFALGLNVLIEKPAGVDAADVKGMNEDALKSGKAFGIMFNQRTNPLFRTLKYYVDIGLLGEIKRFNWIINNWYRSQAYYDSAGWRATWNGEGGGVLLNQCPHNLDIWQWITGMPDRLTAFCRQGHFHRIAVEDDVTIYAEYKNGASATFVTSTGEYPGTNRLEISGTYGKAVAEDGEIKLSLLHEDERNICFNSSDAMPKERVTEIVLKFEEKEDGHVLILKNFTNHLLAGETLIAPGIEGINSLRISNAAYVSSWTGKTVDVPADEEAFTKLISGKRKQEKEEKTAPRTTAEIKENVGEYDSRWSVRW